jgi:hypothetical protein
MPNARINEQSLAGGFFAAQREKGDSLPKSGKMHWLGDYYHSYSLL